MHCCGSGSGIRGLFDSGIRDGLKSQDPDPGSGMEKIRIWDPGQTSRIRNTSGCLLCTVLWYNVTPIFFKLRFLFYFYSWVNLRLSQFLLFSMESDEDDFLTLNQLMENGVVLMPVAILPSLVMQIRILIRIQILSFTHFGKFLYLFRQRYICQNVQYFCQCIEIFWKKVQFYFKFCWNGYGSGSGKILPTRPDPDPKQGLNLPFFLKVWPHG
jgi:hypothetical protein